MSMTRMHDHLLAVRSLISVEERWTKEFCARDKYGEQVDAVSRYAVCFCLFGASLRVEKNKSTLVNNKALCEALNFAGIPEMTRFNDAATHAQVLARIDYALEKLK